MNGESAARTKTADVIDITVYRDHRRSSVATQQTNDIPPPAAASTDPRNDHAVVLELERQAKAEIVRLAGLSEDETFEDGMDNTLSRGVTKLVVELGGAAVRALRSAYVSGQIDASFLEEAIRWLGSLDDHEQTRSDRFWLFVWGLRDTDKRVKDASTLALASLEDPAAAPYLEWEAEGEEIPALKSFMRRVAAELGELGQVS